MAFTGDLKDLNIVDIIQLIHATRQTGIFFVKGASGESRIVFSNGSIVGANHLDNSVRIGTVLVRTGAITIDDLKQAMDVMKNADKDRMPLLATLIQIGSLKHEDALRGLKKLAEMTICELMSWSTGTFTFDTDPVVVASEGTLDLGVDAQMVLMDALRISDERERDRKEGKEVPSFLALYPDVLPEESSGENKEEHSVVTADDLGLADLDRLEKKIPRPVSETELFDPLEIHGRKVRELLPGFTSSEQEAFFSFLKRSLDRKARPDAAAKQAVRAIVLFSSDALISHSVLSLCNEEGVLVFATDDEQQFDRMVAQCLLAARTPVVVFDDPGIPPKGGSSRDTIAHLRDQVRSKYPTVPVIQFAPLQDSDFILRSYQNGVRAVLPKPFKDDRRQTYINDMVHFLESFRSYVKSFQYGQDDADIYGKKLKDGVTSLRKLTNPSDAALVVLMAVSEMFDRAVTLLVRTSELIGERAIGIGSEKSLGPVPADRLKVQLAKPSVFRDAVEKGRAYYGDKGDTTLRTFFGDIGRPLSPNIVLLPLTCDQKVVAVIYGDFGQKEAAPVRLDMLEILALQAGMVLEHAIFRRQMEKAAQKS